MRGVFKSTAMCTPGVMTLDDEDRRELKMIIDDLKHLYRVPMPA
jgi:hypothetical protein